MTLKCLFMVKFFLLKQHLPNALGHLNIPKRLLHPNPYTLKTCEFFVMVFSFLFQKTPKENMRWQERINELGK